MGDREMTRQEGGARRRSEAMEASVDGMAILNPDDEYVYVNQAHADIYGYDDPEELLGNTWRMLYDEEEEERIENEIFPELAEEGEWRGEATGVRADGSEFPEELSLTRLDDGGLVCVVRDISERRERERELERYKAFVESSSDVIVHLKEDGTVLYNSPSIEEVLGYGQEETVGDNAFDYVHPDDRERMLDLFESSLDGSDTGNENTAFRVRHADGSYVWVEDAAGDQTDTRFGDLVITLRDITDRKEREKELERYETFLQNSSDIFAVLDEDGKYIYNSPSVERILGYDPDEHTGEYSLDYVHPDDMDDAVEWFYSLVEGDKVINQTEVRYRHADGSYVWFEIIGTDQRDTEVGGIFFNAREITERKEREQELSEERKAMKTVLSNVPVVVFALNEDGVFTRSQGMALNKIGLESGEAVGESVFEMYGDSPEVVETIERALSGEQVQTTVENSERTLEVWYEPCEDEEETTSSVVGLAYDVTEREEREQELERYEAFIEHSSDVVTLVEEDGTLLYYSPSVEVHAGHGKEERIGDNIYDYIHPEDRERVMKTYTKLLNEPDTRIVEEEFRYQRGDGSYIWVESHGTDQRDTDLGGIVVNSRDITERKEREQELERYEAFIENSSDSITHLDEDGTILYRNPSSERVEDEPDMDGTVAFEHVHPEDRERAIEAFETLLKDPETDTERVEYRSRRADGSYDWVETVGTDQRDTEVGGVVLNSRVINDRKEREQELRRNRELLGHTEHISDTGGWELTVETNDLRWTEGTRDIHEVPEDYEPTVEEAIEFYHPDDRERIRRSVEMCREEGEPFDEELRLITAEGRQRWVRSRGEPVIEDGEVVGLRGAIQDITERKERERELRERKEQMDFFNSLLRHDMLNSMTVINGNAELLKEKLDDDDERELAEKISKHSTEIVELTERVRSVLRRLTEGGSTEMSPIDLSEVVEERCDALEETYPEVTCRAEMPESLCVMANSFLSHVINNVLVNSVEHNDKDEPRISINVEEDDETATVRVADNGPGIPDDKKETVFDQGTTGRSSGGVGFGLYYVDAMVSEYGGDVRVEDNTPEGAVFVLELPKAEEGAEDD